MLVRTQVLPVTLPPVNISEQDGVRYLHLGSIWVQGAMRIDAPRRIELLYVQRMLASLLWLPTSALADGTALQLGLGAGAITRFTHRELGWPTTAVELNPLVIGACRLWFELPEDGAGLSVRRDDALRWLQAQSKRHRGFGPIRLLHVDLYDEDAAAPVLDHVDFYAACRQVLEPGGVMSVNLFGRRASFAASMARIAQAFGADQLWHLRPTREGNSTAIAGHAVRVPGREELLARANHIEARFGDLGLEAKSWLRLVRPYRAGEDRR